MLVGLLSAIVERGVNETQDVKHPHLLNILLRYGLHATICHSRVWHGLEKFIKHRNVIDLCAK
jgi:hypothetical protein